MNFKSILACAALLIGIGTATAAVESEVVGYQSIDIKPGFNMIAFNFQPLEGEGVSIQDFVANKDALVAGSGAANSDQIQVWDGSKFTVYFYRAYKATNPGKFTDGPAWVKVGSGTTSVKTEDTIPVGSGVWFARPKTAPEGEITVSGKITTESGLHTIKPGFNMISSAFPAELPLNDGPIDWEACGAIAGSGAANSDQIQVWNGTEFTIYFYRAYKATNPGKFTDGPAWVKVGSGTTSIKTEDTIPAGKGFWFARPKGEAEGTLTEASPIAE